jgi:catechol 2,3-dioxygenase-like lactoylglutathione lyase family enzyme
MAYINLDHVQLAMPPGEEDRARSFYRDVLGFTEIPLPAPLRGGGIWFRSGPVELHLGFEPGFRAARKAHPAMHVDNLDELATRCGSAGYPVRWDTRYPGRRRFFVDDPFGNRVELLQPELD